MLVRQLLLVTIPHPAVLSRKAYLRQRVLPKPIKQEGTLRTHSAPYEYALDQ